MTKWRMVPLGSIAEPICREIVVEAGTNYRTIGVKWWGEGAYERQTIDGAQTAAKKLWLVRNNDLIINKIWVRHGSTAIATKEVDGCAASNEFPTFQLDDSRIVPRWIHWLSKTRRFWNQCDALSMGTSGKNRIKPEKFLTIEIPLPLLQEQQRFVEYLDATSAKIEEARRLRQEATSEAEVLSAIFAKVIERDTAQLATTSLLDHLDGHDSGWSPQCEDFPAKKGEWAVLKTTAIQWDGFHAEENKRLLPGMAPRTLLTVNQGDVLITRAGPVNRVGVACVVPIPQPNLMLSDKIVRLKTKHTLTPHFLALYLRTPKAQEYFRQGKTGLAESQVNISRDKLLRLPVKVPSHDIQVRLTGYVQTLQQVLHRAIQLHHENAAEIDALLPSVLNTVFNGAIS